jgi:hypothetical protein
MKHEQNMNKIIILYTVTRYSMYELHVYLPVTEYLS